MLKLLLIMNFCVQNDVLYKHLIPESSLNCAFHRIVPEKNVSFLSEGKDIGGSMYQYICI